MRKLREILRSFSFRAGILVFLCLSITLLTLRVLIYTEALHNAYEDTRLIIDAHAEEIDEAMEKYGSPYAKELIRSLVSEAHDKHLYLAIKKNGTITGNFPTWPDIPKTSKDYHEREYIVPDMDTPLHLLVRQINYPRSATLVVGYEMWRIDQLRASFVSAMLVNVLLALIVSLVISVLIVWLLNRHLLRFNRACEKVMQGNLAHRIKVKGRTDQFDKLAHNLNRMLDWNSALLTTVKDSSHAMAHDMRTPLSRLRLELQGISDTTHIDASARTLLKGAIDRLDSVVEMFDHLLNIANAQSRMRTEMFEPLDMGALLNDVLELYEPIIGDKHLTLTKHIPSAALWIKGDRQLLGQALVNLLDNACKYTPEGGTIIASVQQNRHDIVCSIADNGPGIDPELREKVKERFFRADTSRHTYGYGLGLSLVEAVAQLHHGSLSLEDNAPGLNAVLRLNIT